MSGRKAGSTEGGQPVEDALGIVARLGVSIEFAREHKGEHRCVEDREVAAWAPAPPDRSEHPGAPGGPAPPRQRE